VAPGAGCSADFGRIIWRRSELLLMRVTDDSGALKGWRPLGGSIEFGERADETLRREFQEELGQAIAEPRLLCVLENLYEHSGQKGHEVVFVFETAFVDMAAYSVDRFTFVDGGTLHAEWIDRSRFEGSGNLFPAGLASRLAASTSR
jgi:ADP-ribose pyrophosphatase YjhB (NUDIX family)